MPFSTGARCAGWTAGRPISTSSGADLGPGETRMSARFTTLDWAVVGGYVLILALAGTLSTRRQRSADDYFLAGHRVPIWLIAISVLSTTQSAATFLGAPDYSYRGDYTYLAS